MALVNYIDFHDDGKGFEVRSSSIPPSGFVAILLSCYMNKEVVYGYNDDRTFFRYSLNGGSTFTAWSVLKSSSLDQLSLSTESLECIFQVMSEPSMEFILNHSDPTDLSFVDVVYHRTAFADFFESSDWRVIGWAFNVLEKLYEDGIVPKYISRKNSKDYCSFFFSICQMFAFVVVFARQFLKVEETDVLLRSFVEQWGITYDGINTPEERVELFSNWMSQFYQRGTNKIGESGAVVNGELMRLVGYEAPMEFLFTRLLPHETGWCLGHSSPTWNLTDSVNSVIKSGDYGLEFTPFRSTKGVFDRSTYPVTSLAEVAEDGGVSVFVCANHGLVIDPDENPDLLVAISPRLSYDVYVWVKALKEESFVGFGIKCYDKDKNRISATETYSGEAADSFDEGVNYTPILRVGEWFCLKGVVHNLSEDLKGVCELNFPGGVALQFNTESVKYMYPYISLKAGSIEIGGLYIKPRTLPFTQGYLGQKNIMVLYSELNSTRTTDDIVDFIKRYLISYKNVLACKWLGASWHEEVSQASYNDDYNNDYR